MKVTADMVDAWRSRIEDFAANPDEYDLSDLLREMHNVWCELQREEIEDQ